MKYSSHFAPLFVLIVVLAGSFGARQANANSDIDYVLTALADPVKPGAVAEFVLMVTNHSAVAERVTMQFTVPQYTTFNGYPAGTVEFQTIPTSNAYVPAGATQGAIFRLTVLGGNVAPPDGTVITLSLTDNAQAVTIMRSIVVRSAPKLDLQLSTNQSSVAPGANFTYNLTYHNSSSTTLAGGALSLPVPAGATFVSATGGGVKGSDGVVRWALGTLHAGVNGRRSVTFKAAAGNYGALLIDATLRDTAGAMAHASTTLLEDPDATPSYTYTLTTTSDSVKPGGVAEFVAKVTNYTATAAKITASFTVPANTTFGADYPAGTAEFATFPRPNAYVPPGATQALILRLNVLGGNVSPPDGTTITLNLVDLDTGVTISRSVVVQSAPKLDLQLSTGQSSVAPGANFTHILTYNNSGTAAISSATLSVPVPAGTTFVSASDGGALGSDGFVRWTLGTLKAGLNDRRTVTFKAPAGKYGALLVDAVLTDLAGDAARASTTIVEDANASPAFTYTLTTTTNPVRPGAVAEFVAMVTNHTTDLSKVTMSFTVPPNTTFGFGDPAGTDEFQTIPISNAYVPAGATQTVVFRLSVLGANLAPPDGTAITLSLVDTDTGVTISRSVVVQAAPALDLELSTSKASVAPGTSFTHTLTYYNSGTIAADDVELSVPIPAGASFVSASDGGTLDEDGVVRWSLGTLDPYANGQPTLTLKALAGKIGPLVLEAALTDSAGDAARASTTMLEDASAMPAFTYSLTTAGNSVQPGDVVDFTSGVTNHTTTAERVSMNFTVPLDATFNDYPAGTSVGFTIPTANAYVPPGETKSYTDSLPILGGADAPPPGAPVTLTLRDLFRGITISHTVLVQGVAPARHFGNISTRLSVGTGDNVLIGGFIVTGTQSKRVIVRGIGPSLPLGGALANPFLELHDSTGATIASNDDWVDSPDKQAIIDSTIPPTNHKESAIIMALTPGAYTGIVRGVNNTTGIGLVEVYDLNAVVDSKLANISTRGFVQTRNNVLIGGVIILNENPTKIILRAIGPSLPVTGKLGDPLLELHNSDGDLIFSNDNWKSNQQADIIATGVPPTNDKESAIVATLNPGNYTAIVRGVNNTTGVALVEAYDLQ